MLTDRPEVFWEEIAPCDHILQIYEDDREYLQALGRFVSDGFRQDESVIVIATARHLIALEQRLGEFATDILRIQSQYISLDAEQTLAQFMVDGWPDQKRFEETIIAVLRHAGQGGRRVRVFREMIAAAPEGPTRATFHLEYLWHQLQKKQAFALFCAYPKKDFTKNSADAFTKICEAHSKMVPAGALDFQPLVSADQR